MPPQVNDVEQLALVQPSHSMRDVASSLVQLLKKEIGLHPNTSGQMTIPIAKANDIGKSMISPLLGSMLALRSSLWAYEQDIEDCPPLGLPEIIEVPSLADRLVPQPNTSPRRRSVRIEGRVRSSAEVEAECKAIWDKHICSPAVVATGKTVSLQVLTDAVVTVMHSIAVQIFRAWHSLLMLCQQEPHAVVQVTKIRVDAEMRRRFDLSVLRAQPALPEALLQQPTGRTDEEQLRTAAALRATDSYQQNVAWGSSHAGASLHDTCMPTGTPATQHILFEESYTPAGHGSSSAPKASGGKFAKSRIAGEGHIFVFCHGFQVSQAPGGGFHYHSTSCTSVRLLTYCLLPR